MSKWVLSKEENVGQDFVELVFVASEKCRTGFCREGNRRTGFCRKRKMSNRFCYERKSSDRVLSEGKLTEWVLPKKEIVKPDFVEKGKCQTGFVGREIVE